MFQHVKIHLLKRGLIPGPQAAGLVRWFIFLTFVLILLLVIPLGEDSSDLPIDSHTRRAMQHQRQPYSYSNHHKLHKSRARRDIRDLDADFGQMPGISKIMDTPLWLRTFLEKPVINPHPYKYIHNQERRCFGKNIEILFVVPSAPGNIRRRQRVRNSMLYAYASNPNNNASLLFFIGQSDLMPLSARKEIIQAGIESELERFDDIVQADFSDIYKNIRLKAVSMLKWASTFCYTAKYVIRTDDDVYVNVRKIVSVIRRTGHRRDNFILGKVRQNSLVPRSRKSKYFVHPREYGHSRWPVFAQGGLLGYPLKTVRLLYEASLRVRPVWLDDVYITAMCRKEVRARLLSNSKFMFREV